jgi:energy-converting hydrogenase Eha subunit B
VPPNDTLALPINGQFLMTDDVMQVKASAGTTIDVTMSYTVGQAEQDDVV